MKTADRVAGYFLFAVIGIAVLTFFGWGLINAVAVLIIACPCRARPRPCRSWSRPAKQRLKGCCSAMLRRSRTFRKIDTLMIDKTGSLTEGKPAFERVIPARGYAEDEVLRLAASIAKVGARPGGSDSRRRQRVGFELDNRTSSSRVLASVSGRDCWEDDCAGQHGVD